MSRDDIAFTSPQPGAKRQPKVPPAPEAMIETKASEKSVTISFSGPESLDRRLNDISNALYEQDRSITKKLVAIKFLRYAIEAYNEGKITFGE